MQIHIVLFLLFKEIDYLISQAEKSVEVTNTTGIAVAMTNTETCKQEITCNFDSTLNSVHVQTLPVEYFGRSQSTQTLKKLEDNKTMVTKGTQTCITSDLLLTYLMPKMVSTCSQTDPVNKVMDKDEKADSDESGKESGGVEISRSAKHSESVEQSANESDGEESCGEESCSEDYSMTSGEESEMEGCAKEDKELNDEPIILTNEKSVKDQLKFIICEESIATTFGMCLKCGSRCSVSVTSIIGSYCKIIISCSSSAEHSISWSTGPLLNRLPAFNLLMASSILSTGMESNKTMRFMESLNILCFKRRELSNIQSAYVIPAVLNVWKMEQHQLLAEIKGKPIEVASDMRVDSPGHCGLLGAGSTLDVDRNVILDTQIIKVI